MSAERSGVAVRWIVDPPRDGSWNMAADETLLENAVAGEAAVRVYRWNRPTWSLGRSQAYAGSVDPEFCRRHGIDVVRRPTGGWALLHDRELTYAVAAPGRGGVFEGSPLAVYEKIAAVLVRGLGSLGVPLAIVSQSNGKPGDARCFTAVSSHEIVAGGGKLVGSAQRRRRGAFLQHGSIPIAFDPVLETGAAGEPAERARIQPTLSALLGRAVPFEEVADALENAFSLVPGLSLVRSSWTMAELERIEKLRAFRYLDARWTIGATQPLAAVKPVDPAHSADAAQPAPASGSSKSTGGIRS